MPWNALLPALLGGYLFLHYSFLYRFRLQRLDGYHLLFQTATCALFLGLAARLACRTAGQFWPELPSTWQTYFPDRDFPYSGTAILAFVLGPGCAALANLSHFRAAWAATAKRSQVRSFARQSRHAPGFAPRWLQKAIHWLQCYLYLARLALGRLSTVASLKAINFYGNDLERLLLKAAQEAKLVCVTLRTRKVYVGFVTVAPNLEKRDTHLGLMPAISGYRNERDLTIAFTTTYPTDPATDYTVVLPLISIESANLFDPDEYANRFAPSDDPMMSAIAEDPGDSDADQRSNAQGSDTITD